MTEEPKFVEREGSNIYFEKGIEWLNPLKIY
jgi:hypothetical protein